MSGRFRCGDRVIVEHPTAGRTYGVVEAASPDGTYSVRCEPYINAWTVPSANMTSAACPRDMDIGDLLNLEMLKEAIEVEFLGSLWTHGDSGMMTPHVCEAWFGDGMKLLTVSTINQRPNYHVVRVHSGWGSSNWSDEDNIGEHIDEITDAIEEECGQAGDYLDEPCDNCRDTICKCAEDFDLAAHWPAIDLDTGCSWGEIRWPWLMKRLGITAQIDRLTPAAPDVAVRAA